jgi:His/Glu/Gln/Arg/opine family amino acid ABC transporter permease subunit
MLYGFSGVILQGALVTLELAISSVVLAVLIGLAGAGAKLSANRPLALLFEGYTTLIRGVPDLVLMLLIFYGLQIALNSLTTPSAWSKLISTQWWPVLLPSALSTVRTSRKPFAVLTWLCRKGTLKQRPLWFYLLTDISPDHVPGHDALCVAGHR